MKMLDSGLQTSSVAIIGAPSLVKLCRRDFARYGIESCVVGSTQDVKHRRFSAFVVPTKKNGLDLPDAVKGTLWNVVCMTNARGCVIDYAKPKTKSHACVRVLSALDVNTRDILNKNVLRLERSATYFWREFDEFLNAYDVVEPIAKIANNTQFQDDVIDLKRGLSALKRINEEPRWQWLLDACGQGKLDEILPKLFRSTAR